MGAFTMPATTFNLPPAGGQNCAADYALVPAAGTTLRVSWTADRLVSFRGFFKNQTAGTFTGFQSFVNNSSGNWFTTATFNASDEWLFGIDSVTATGVITFTYSVDNGVPYAVVWNPALAKFCSVHLGSTGKFCSVYYWTGTAWHMQHS